MGAFIFLDTNPNDEIVKYLIKCGLDSGTDEFKSGARMDKYPEQIELRRHLKRLISETKIGVLVSASNEGDFKKSASQALIQIIKNNEFENESELEVFFDQGIFKGDKDPDYLKMKDSLSCKINIEQDSKQIRGIQLADLVAHTCSIMLKESLGLITKKTKAGENSGYDPDMEIEIGFEMWTEIRYNFFSTPPPHPDEWVSQKDCVADVGKKGLYISEKCSELVKEKSLEKFGEMYLGCIH